MEMFKIYLRCPIHIKDSTLTGTLNEWLLTSGFDNLTKQHMSFRIKNIEFENVPFSRELIRIYEKIRIF